MNIGELLLKNREKMMEIEKLKVEKLADSLYSNMIPEISKEAIYCEIRYERDRSSFAGMAFKFMCGKNVVEVRDTEEKVIQEVSKFEKLYVGCERDYINCIKETFSLRKREYGLEILFLIYSDVRSSQIIFEELINSLDRNKENVFLKCLGCNSCICKEKKCYSD